MKVWIDQDLCTGDGLCDTPPDYGRASAQSTPPNTCSKCPASPLAFNKSTANAWGLLVRQARRSPLARKACKPWSAPGYTRAN